MKCLLVVYSYHHNNTQKIAEVFAKVLNAEIINPQQADQHKLDNYDLVGFGAGIDSGKHYKPLLDFADNLPKANGKKVFIFSTFGAPVNLLSQDEAAYNKAIAKNHSALKDKLETKNYSIVAEFACGGFNTNKFLKYLGGVNKGRPNADDLKNAETFAKNLLKTP
jgi:flavodoxin